MRTIGVILALLLAVNEIATRLPAAPTHDAASFSPWRRTADGWEKNIGWSGSPAFTGPRLHPASLTLMQLGAVLGALFVLGRPATETIRGRVREVITARGVAANGPHRRSHQTRRQRGRRGLEPPHETATDAS